MSWVVLALAIGVQAQAPVRPAREGSSRLSGQVISEASGLGLRRARVVIRPLEAGRPAIGVQTDDEGEFEIRDIAPGAYSLSAGRDGYLTTSTFRRGALRMPPQFSLLGGEIVTGINFQLRPWAVLSGRVRYEDGDPAVEVRVALYREYYARARHGFRAVASAATNDRGEYRMHGLDSGSYFVAAQFEGDVTGPEVKDQSRVDASGREIPVPSYTTTFYPNTTRLGEALPVRVRAGEEIQGIDLYLRPVERLKLGGRVTDGDSGAAVTAVSIILERLDAGNSEALPAPANAVFDNNDRFTIDDVAPGRYRLWVTGDIESRSVAGQQDVLLINASIEDREILVLPARAWTGRLVMFDASEVRGGLRPRITLEPRSERGGVVNASARGSDFDVDLIPGLTYDVFVENLPEDFYVSQIRNGGTDVSGFGLTSSMAGSQPFEVVLDSRGGRVGGRVLGPAGEVWSGATVMLIPDPPRDRIASYRQSFADQYGLFQIRGVPPGRYILTAWLDEPACEAYNPAELETCRATGLRVDVAQSGRLSLALNVKARPTR